MVTNYAWLFQTLNEKLKPQHKKTMLQLHYCKLLRDSTKSGEEWMGCLRIKANEWIYQNIIDG